MTVYRIYFKDNNQETGYCRTFENLKEGLEFLNQVIDKFDKVTFKKEEEEDE